jgi:flavin-dependent dehydrogenase
MSEPRAGAYDAIVIGGGPAGSGYAMTLAREGHSVLLLDREESPRFHIGESPLPYTSTRPDMRVITGSSGPSMTTDIQPRGRR